MACYVDPLAEVEELKEENAVYLNLLNEVLKREELLKAQLLVALSNLGKG